VSGRAAGRRCRALAPPAVLALALLAGCASTGSFEHSPRVTLVHLEPVQIRLLEQRYLATIRVQNPNPVALPIDGLEYTVRVNGSEFANGVSRQRVTVPARGEKTLQVGLRSTTLKLLEQVRRFAEAGGALRYAIRGTLGVEGLANGIPFDHDGEIDLRPRPQPRPQPHGRAA